MSEKGRITSVAGTVLARRFSDSEFRLLAVQLVVEFGGASALQIRDACCDAANAVPTLSARQVFLRHARDLLRVSLPSAGSD